MTREVKITLVSPMTGNTAAAKWRNTGNIANFTSSDIPSLNSDDGGASYAFCASGYADMTIAMSTYTLLSNERCVGMRIGVRELRAAGPNKYWIEIPGESVLTYASILNTPSGATGGNYSLYNGPTVSGNISQSSLNGLKAHLVTDFASNYTIATYVYGTLLIQTQPNSVPSVVRDSAGTTNVRPRITWPTPSDYQTALHVKVFTKAVAEDVGFDPTTSPTVYDSTPFAPGAVLQSFYDLPVDLTRGSSYYVYLRTQASSPGSNWWSNWNGSGVFTVRSLFTSGFNHLDDPVTDTSYPTIGWTVTSPVPSDELTSAIKIFSEDQYSETGFDPDTSAPVAQGSFPIPQSPGWTYTVPSPLTNNTNYRAYTKTTSTKTGDTRGWEYGSFSVDLLAPDPPVNVTFTTEDDNYVRIQWETAPGNGSFEPIGYEVTRRANGVQEFASSPVQKNISPEYYWVEDFDATPGVEYTYSIRPFWVVDQQAVYGDEATVDITTVCKKVVLRDIVYFGHMRGIQVPSSDSWVDSTRNIQRDVYIPLGAKRPKVISGNSDFESFSMNFVIRNEETKTALEDLILSGVTIAIITSTRVRYAAVNGSFSVSDYLWNSLRGEEMAWKFSVPFVEVDRP